MTNGEKLKEVFPNAEINYGLRGVVTVTFIHKTIFDLDWWNDEYEEPTDKIDCDNTDCNNCVNHKYCDYESNKSEIPTGSTTKNDLEVREFEEIVVEYPPEDLCTYPEYKGKPYLSIKYKEGNDCSVGYGTYNPKVFSRYLRDYFMPPVTPIKPKGYWIEHQHEAGANWEYSRYECSECHNWAEDDSNYCPCCGIEMDGVKSVKRF